MSVSVSVIIPTHQPPDRICRTLASLVRLPRNDFEVLVVVNGKAAQISSPTWNDLPKCPNFRLIREPSFGLLAGRHRGFQEAAADVVVFLDDDVEIGPAWGEAIRECFADPGVCLAGGPSVPEYQVPPPDWLDTFFWHQEQASWCSYLSLLDYGPAVCDIDPRLIWGLNFAIRRQTLRNHGGFHPDGVPWELRRYRGDGETGLAETIRQAGGRAVYHPEARVTHHIPAARLTPVFFRKRALLQGISDSYTQIRSSGGLVPVAADGVGVRLGNSMRRLARAVLKRSADAPSVMQNQIQQAREAGMRFHRRAVQRDARLLEWVLRENYWDYTCPPTG